MQLDAASRPADLQMIDVKEPDVSDADSRSLPKRLSQNLVFTYLVLATERSDNF